MQQTLCLGEYRSTMQIEKYCDTGPQTFANNAGTTLIVTLKSLTKLIITTRVNSLFVF